MPWLTIPAALQIIVGLDLLNVWLVRALSPTAYRGGDAKTLKEEFAAYELPETVFWIVGVLKVGAALVLIAGVWLALPVDIAAGMVAAVMVWGSVRSCPQVRRPCSARRSKGLRHLSSTGWELKAPPGFPGGASSSTALRLG